jgi:hypothetical protein
MKTSLFTQVSLVVIGLIAAPSAALALDLPPSVPDAGSSAALLTLSVAGVFACRRFFVKGK